MARQNRTVTPAADTTVADTTDQAQEATVTETPAPEAPANTETPAPEAKTDTPPVDLTAFKAAVEQALTTGDKTTGELPSESIDAVNVEYRKIDGTPGKRQARDFLQSSMMEAVGKLDALQARGYSDLSGNLSAAGGSPKASTPSDPAAAFVQRRASLELALALVNADAPVIEGRDLNAEVATAVTEGQALVEQHQAHEANEAEDKGDGPTLTPIVRAALKAASGKATGSRASTGGNGGGVRRDTAKHMTEAFADKQVGDFMKISEIANFKSVEYGDGAPSQGAISARLFPTCTIPGIEGVEASEGQPKGARKVAVEA